jgi:hypothetical protein
MLGQEKPVSVPRAFYRLPRYQEDWRFLSDPATHNDFRDPIKFILLAEDGKIFFMTRR